MFPQSTTSHQVKEDYIYQELSGFTYTVDTCSSLCQFHTPSTPACHFFIVYDGKCMLGNFNSTGTFSAPADSFTAYFNESERTCPSKKNQHMQFTKKQSQDSCTTPHCPQQNMQ